MAELLADCEAKLKAKQVVKNVLPAAKPSAPTPTAAGGRKWVTAAALLLLPVIALAVTEFAGVTHLFRGPEPTPDPLQPGGEPTPVSVAKQETPPPNEWERSVAAMPAAEQVEAVIARLKDLNPGFDGQVLPTIEGGVVTGLEFLTDQVSDIAPVQMFTNLRYLQCNPRPGKTGKLIDLSPLRGLPLTHLIVHDNPVGDLSPLEGMKLISLYCSRTKVADLSPLQGMPLEKLDCGFTRVADLSPLKGMPLELLNCDSCTLVADLSPLKGMPLRHLGISRTNVTDLAPLKGMVTLKRLGLADTGRLTDLSPLIGMQLDDISLTPKNITQGLDILRAMKSLKIIAIGGAFLPAAEFWERYDKGEFKD